MVARARSGKSNKTAIKAKAAAAVSEIAPVLPPRPVLQKAFDKSVELTPEECLQAAHWIRQIIGVLVGLGFGIAKFTGAPAILTFLVIVTLAPSALLQIANELDTEEIAKISPIQTEGLMPAFALFLLSWILSYTVFLQPGS